MAGESQLRASGRDDIGGRAPAVVGVADHIIGCIREDCGASIVAAIGIGGRHLDGSIGTDLHHAAVIATAGEIRRIVSEGRIRVGYVDGIRWCDVRHEGDRGAVGRKIEGDFGLGAETGGDHGSRDGKRINQCSDGRQLVEKNGRCDAEAAVDEVIVKNIVGAGGRCVRAAIGGFDSGAGGC